MRAEKQLLLEEIKSKIDLSTSVVFTKYTRLTPNTAARLRQELAQKGSELEVVRKRMLIKAIETVGFPVDSAMLEGHIAVVFANGDPVAMAKALFQFNKEHEDLLTILGGRFEGQVCTAMDVGRIATLPSHTEMRAQFLSLLEAPMSQTLAVIEALLTSVMHCLHNKTEGVVAEELQ